jgi:phage terminase Nu1 subunit (DNA packaging protein)
MESSYVSVQTVAAALGLTTVHVQRLTRAGVLTKVGHGKYDLDACVSSYAAYKAEDDDEEAAPPELIAERARLTAAQASLAEYRLRAETGRYVGKDETHEAWNTLVSSTSSRLHLLTSVDLQGTDDACQIEFILRKAVYEALDDLATAAEETQGKDDRTDIIKKQETDDEPLDLEEEKVRLTSAQASLAELKLSVERGDVVLVEEVQASWIKRISNCRSKLLSLPNRLAPLLVAYSQNFGTQISQTSAPKSGQLRQVRSIVFSRVD